MNDEGQVTEAMTVTEPSKEQVRADRQAGMDQEEQPIEPSARSVPDQEIDDEQTRQWAAEGIPPADVTITQVPIGDTPFGRPGRSIGRSTVPQPMVSPTRTPCQHCDGRGFMPGINDLLRESIGLLGESGDEVVRTFYTALFQAAPDLVSLFPGDPREGDFGSDHRGAKQRELLLEALAALATNYDPADAEKMAGLDAALKRFGRAHAAFVRKDGTIKGATWEEYAAVKEALFTTLVRAAGELWRPEFTEAWGQAYDYAAAAMLIEQYRSGFAAPRFARS